MNRLVHGCSYTRLEKIDTAMCMERSKLLREVECLFSTAYIPNVLAFDNIGRQEEVLSGAGTSHWINGIIVQPMFSSCAPPTPATSVKTKDKKRTSKPIYVLGKSNSPPPIVLFDLRSTFVKALLSARRLNSLWIMVPVHNTGEQQVNSWTSFKILTRDHKEVKADTIEYLPTINASATTVQEVLQQCISIKASYILKRLQSSLIRHCLRKQQQLHGGIYRGFGVSC